MAMDVKRDPKILKRKKIRQTIIWSLVGIAVIGVSAAVMRLRPAAPSVAFNTLWFGVVKRGPMVREVRGAGTLVPEEIRWITSTASGRVAKIVLRPGMNTQVKPGTIIVELSNPDLEQSVANARVSVKSAEAQYTSAVSTLEQSILQQKNAIANLKSQVAIAKQALDADKELQAQGIVATLTVGRDQATYDQALGAMTLAQQTLDTMEQNRESTLAPGKAAVDLQKANFDTVARQLEELHVRSSMSGRLQLLAPNIEEGAQVTAGSNIARVSDPGRLKAQIRISETQTKDLALGQTADIDTRTGHVKGHVSNIDPASSGGTVGVDVTLDEALPPGARPDLSVDGTIELQRLENVLYVDHPTSGTENSTVGLFKVLPNSGESTIGPQQEAGHEAVQTSVKFGRSSVQYIEVIEGLKEGDHVILSDMSQYDGNDRIKISS
jgi:HlyD family secretion protein